MARQTHECRNCGAPLGIPEDHERFFTCRYCGSVLEDVTPPEAKATGRVDIVVSTATVDPATLATYSKPTRGIWAFAIISTLVAVVIGGVAVLASAGSDLLGESSPLASGSRIHSWAVAAPLPTDNSTGSDVVGVARSSDAVETAYLDLDADDPVRWSIDRPLEDETFVQFVPTEELVVVSSGTELFALNRATGDEAWAATLSDAVQPNICTGCAQRFGDVVTTLTADGVLSAHAIADGQPRWSVRMTETPRQVVDIGGNPAVLDTVGEAVVLRVLSAADGSDLEQLPLSCPDTTFGGREDPGIYDHLVPLGDGTVVWLGNGPFGACAQRWGADSGGVPMWEAPYEHGNPSGIDPQAVRVAGGALVIVSGTTVDVVDLATGAPRRVVDRPDTELYPIGVHEGTVVVAERTTRGTPRWSVVAIDLGAGNERWRFEPEAADRIEGTRDFAIDDAWTAAITSKGVAVVQHRDDSVELVVQTIPVASGTASAPATIDLSGRTITDSVSTHGWTGDHLLVSVGGDFVVVDAAEGRIAGEAG